MAMADSLQHKTIWITGASTGIGYALAKTLAAKGNRIIITARHQSGIDDAVSELGDSCFGIVWDVADHDGIDRVKNIIETKFGHLDIAILNAGTCEYIDSENFDAALSARVINTNVNGFANSAAVALPLLRKSMEKSSLRPYLLGVSSLSTYAPLPRAEAYGASKAAVTYMLETLRVDLFKEGIDVSVINPGFVKTALTDRNDFPMPFLISVEQAADYIVKGMQKRAYEIVFPPALTWSLRLLSWLPTSWYVRFAQSMKKTS
jgi:short-subunit dehydrogenase